MVKANETGLVMIQSFDPIYAEFTIAEDRLAEVRANMAKGTLKALVSVPGSDDAVSVSATTQPTTQAMAQATTQPGPHEGTLDMLDNTVQESSGTVRLRATIPNPDRHFWPGQFVHVRLVLSEKKDAVLIPGQAIQVGQQGPYVYVVKHDDQKQMDIAEMRPIVAGQLQGDLMIVIEKGLEPGDKVITTGQLLVVPNSPVTVAPPQNGAQVAEAKS